MTAKTFQLANGIKGVCDERPGLGKVSMRVVIKHGSAYEKAEEAGLTFLAQEATNGGTTSRTRAEVAASIEGKGGFLATVSGRETTEFSITGLAHDSSDLFEILSDIIRKPAYDIQEVEKTKKQVEHWIEQQDQDPSNRSFKQFYEAAYAGSSAAHSPMGDKELLASYTAEDVKRKHAEILAAPENIVISFAGDITADEAEKLAQQYWSDLQATAPAAQADESFTAGDIRQESENEQLNLVFGFEAPDRHDPARYRYVLLNELLSGGMSAPLFQEIREKRGLVYGVGSTYNALEESGAFAIYAGTGKGNAGELITATFELLGTLTKTGFSQQELDTARARLVRQARAEQETVEKAGGRNATQLLQHGELVSPEEWERRLESVSPDDIRQACAEMLASGNCALSAYGPLDSLPEEAEIKALMQAQLSGITLPISGPAAPLTKPLAVEFNEAAHERESKEPQITVLPNGLKIVTVERPGTLSCGAWVGAGSGHETPELNGATHMNEHMMFKGTPSYGPGIIDQLIENKFGGDLNAYTSKDQTAYYFYNLLGDDLEPVIDICGEMVFQANLDQEEFDGKKTQNPDGSVTKAKGERDVVIEEIKRSNDNINNRKWDAAFELAYPDQAMGRPILGTEETLRAMDTSMLAAYRDEYYGPNNVAFIAVGPVTHEEFVEVIERKYGHLQAVDFPELPKPAYQGGTSVAEAKTATLVNTALVMEGVANTDPEYPAYEALGEILGSGASSRLHTKIVDELGLSAGVGAGSIDYRHCGLFGVFASVKAENLKPFIKAVYDEIKKAAQDISEEELAKVKTRMEVALVSDIESNRACCDHYGRLTLAEGDVADLEEQRARINALTVEDIKAVAEKILQSNPTVPMVTPPGTDPALIPSHEEILALRDEPPSAGPAQPQPTNAPA